jgi:hypothetical protein
MNAFNNLEAALQHLQKHVKPMPSPGQVAVSASSNAGTSQAVRDPLPEPNLKDWVMSSTERRLEETNEGALKVLTQACEIAKDIFAQAKELAQGVENEDGQMSQLYTLPQRLVEAFRNLCVVYMATERALHHTEEAYKKDDLFENDYERSNLPYSETGLEVLKRFGQSACHSLFGSRHELCWMARSNPRLDVFRNLSLGPEYVCGWMMRRLLVKPLETHMSVGDMYREYVSTIVSIARLSFCHIC